MLTMRSKSAPSADYACLLAMSRGELVAVLVLLLRYVRATLKSSDPLEELLHDCEGRNS